MKINRLGRLADLLENYQGDGPEFDLNDWSFTEVEKTGMLWWRRTEIKCHTAACAIGLACIQGTFENDGLSWVLEGDCIVPTYRDLKCRVAACKFFEVTDAQFNRLFIDDSYDGPTKGIEGARAVAARIRAMIARQTSRKTKRTTPAVEKIKREAFEKVGS